MLIKKFAKIILFSGVVSLSGIANAEVKNTTNITIKSDIVQTVSKYNFEETIQRLKKSIDAKGLTLFAVINHTAAAKKVKLNLLPNTVLIFGSPVAGTPIMQEHPSVALDLPFRVLISETKDNIVYVSYHSPKSLAVHRLSDKQLSLLSNLAKLVDNTIK